MHLFQLYIAGIWPMVLNYGLVTIGVVGCLAAAWFSPVFKSDFVWAAGCLLVSAVVYSIGVHDERLHCTAQNEIAIEQAVAAGNSARDEAVETVKKQMANEAKQNAAPVGKLPFIHAPPRLRKSKPDPFNRDTK